MGIAPGCHQTRIDYFGQPYWIDYLPAQAALLKAEPWYTGVPFLSRNGRAGVHFMTGFLALRGTLARHQPARWPRRLEMGAYRNFGSDIVLGELARQQNWSQARHVTGAHVRDELQPHDPSANGNGKHRAEAERAPS